jgi:transmembrane sensor
MDKTRIKYLLDQYANNLASKDEVKELFALIEHAETDEVLKETIQETGNDASDNIELPQQQWNSIWAAIQSATVQQPKKNKIISLTWMRAAAAAVILFAVAGAAYFFTNKKQEQTGTVASTTHYKNDVLPGGNKATLTLADGSVIVLDSMQNGTLTQQGNTMIVKAADGQLVYHANTTAPNEILYNTVSTPSGGSYRLTLPDGSKVWLNAASALRFPAAFEGKARNVELTGEAYFEVAKNAAMPFHVKAEGTDVKVLGTHFNVMAYPDEQTINTTLLEGKVKVTHGNTTKDLEPGMEAIVDKHTRTIKITTNNTEQSTGWKNDVFRFKETSIQELMRQVERWYNVEVEYKTTGDNQNFTGLVPRTQNVSALLQTLELTGTVHFEVEQTNTPGKAGKIIVLP